MKGNREINMKAQYLALALILAILAAIACGTGAQGVPATTQPDTGILLAVQQTQTAAAVGTNAGQAPSVTAPPPSQPTDTSPPLSEPSATAAEASTTVEITTTITVTPSPTLPSGSTSTPGAGPVVGPTSDQPGQPGVITGGLSYPSEGIPRLKVYAWDRGSGQWRYVITAQNQNTYELQVPPGKYIVFAWLADGGPIAGGYTNAVPCGLSAACTDHTLYVVTVGSGQHVAGVDVTDWYGPEGFIPKPPG